MNSFNGLGLHLGNLSLLSEAKSRSISAENPTGASGMGARAEPDLSNPNAPARELGVGWKCRPYVSISAGETAELALIDGPGAIQSLWFAGSIILREFILRVYWDDQEHPSIECPLPDFFAMPWSTQHPKQPLAGPLFTINSTPVVVNPNRGLNCFWEMPFRKRCRITLENREPERAAECFYQINYTLTDVPDYAAYFHAQFRQVNPLPYKQPYLILDGISGQGHYVGTSMGWGINNDCWWGEGEVKFYIDDDKEFPTICGTGLEDYFGGAWAWDVDNKYITYSTPFMGMHDVQLPNGLYQSQHRHSMYRWHVMDPIRFDRTLRVDVQALGWRKGHRYYPGQHDISSVAFWYQTLPTAPFPPLGDRDALEVIMPA